MNDLRIGHGYDIHRLQAGGRLILGGIDVADGISPIAYSDGDVVIHAIADAIIGALGTGDIGEHFPNNDPAHKDAPSVTFLEKLKIDLKAGQWRVVNVDVTVLAERPKLKKFKPLMKDFLEGVLGCPVNIKAGTNEECDSIGRGESIAAHAVVLLALDV